MRLHMNGTRKLSHKEKIPDHQETKIPLAIQENRAIRDHHLLQHLNFLNRTQGNFCRVPFQRMKLNIHGLGNLGISRGRKNTGRK